MIGPQLEQCNACGERPSTDRSHHAYVGIACYGCYDGAEDSSTRNWVGSGCTQGQSRALPMAIADWGTVQQDIRDSGLALDEFYEQEGRGQ